MNAAIRILLSASAAVATFYFAFWISLAFMPLNTPFSVGYVIGLGLAAGVGWFVWSSSGSGKRPLFSSMCFGAIIVGTLGFLVGFFGPMILTPSANQGPLLGLFITGPVGVLLGAIGGLIYGLKRKPRDPGKDLIQ